MDINHDLDWNKNFLSNPRSEATRAERMCARADIMHNSFLCTMVVTIFRETERDDDFMRDEGRKGLAGNAITFLLLQTHELLPFNLCSASP